MVVDALAVYEVESKDRSVRESPVVDRLSRAHNLVSECNQIAHSRARADVLQIRTTWSPFTPLTIHGHLRFGVFQGSVEVLHLLFVGKV